MWVGVDPGGKQAFGLAILADDGHFESWCVSCADQAAGHISQRPKGIGIDAPLWWSSGPSGDRVADQWIRERYRIRSGTVQAANSLRGAALVQGVLFAELMRRKFPGVPVTEAHPKALLKALDMNWPTFCTRFSISGPNPQEHERDAVIAAVAAREGFEKRWLHDLAEKRRPTEQNPSTHWLAPIHYFWPG
jgi:predicted nuclease with RNAse H fold